MDPTALETLWFVLIVVLWLGYFFLEGFDFGVGMLLPALGRSDHDRRVMLNTVGPIWDGNEVWLLVAGGATFAAFPEWYAALFSGFYLPLLLVLLALIMRNVAFEFRGKHHTTGWRRLWDWSMIGGSFLPSLLWGVAFANVLRGVPMNADHQVSASLLDLLNPYALLGGLTSVALFASHGAAFLVLRTDGDLRARARRTAMALGPVAAVLAAGFLIWTLADMGDGASAWAVASAVVAAVGAVAAPLLSAARREALAFAGAGAAIVAGFLTVFLQLWPNVLVSSTDPANSLTVAAAASTGYTLTIMTVVAAVLLPLILAYQAWTYWIFRKRVTGGHQAAAAAAEADPA